MIAVHPARLALLPALLAALGGCRGADPAGTAPAALKLRGQDPAERMDRAEARMHRYRDVARRMNDLFEGSSDAAAESSPPPVQERGRRNLRALGSVEAVERSLGAAREATDKNVEEHAAAAAAAASASARKAVLSRAEMHQKLQERLTDSADSFDNSQDVEEIFEDVYEHDERSEINADEVVADDGGDAPEGGGDYYADLPDFVVRHPHGSASGSGSGDGTQDTQASGDDIDGGWEDAAEEEELQQCKCVDCPQDELCGGIWKREVFPPSQARVDFSKVKVHVVVSHCMSDLDWIPAWTATAAFPVASVHVVSKCGREDRARATAPEWATVEAYENLGRCDHTYAHYITKVLPRLVKPGEEENTVAIFLKDDISAGNLHQSGHWNDFEGLVRAAGSTHGFGCGIIPGGVEFGRDSFDLSTYHETKTLHSFSMETYTRSRGGRYKFDLEEFVSEYKDLSAWWQAMGAPEPPEAIQVCYGGVFSGSFRNIYKSTDVNKVIAEMDGSMWKNVEVSLSRGNNIQEGHYAERSWAPMIQTHLPQYQLEALLEKADGVYMNKSSFHGTLLRRPKLFLHVGSEGTSSTEVLRESLVAKRELLELDGYKIAVHGKHEDGENGFPNMDNLGACMWSAIKKSQFPPHMKKATVCDQHLLPDLTAYMKEAFEASHDMIMLNPTLTSPGSAEPLSIYFDYVWDVRVAIYYRRFFEWITFKYASWREDKLEHSLVADEVPTSYRYVDFLRENCKQLFYGMDVNEDGFPMRKLRRDVKKEGTKRGSTAMSKFKPTTNFDLEELTGLEDYVYFVAKQYYSETRFRRGIKIINYHDLHSIETDFYCHVLHDASNTCNEAVEQEMQEHDAGHRLKSKFHAFVSPSVALEDVAIEAYFAGRLDFDATQPRKKFMDQISLWKDMIARALKTHNLSTENLPTECLYKYERARLLEASLAYERSLLPDFFASPRGAPGLKADFEKQRFCSVDAAAVLSEPAWDFLFERAEEFVVPQQRRAFVHIGAPPTGEESIDTALLSDADVLREDGHFLFAGHGRLAPCVWSEAQQRLAAVGDGGDEEDASCSESVLPRFRGVLSDAAAADGDVVVSDGWLSAPSSETGLKKALGDFDPVVVLYYRPFYDWILSSYYHSHLKSGGSKLESMSSHVGLVDYIRKACSRLFASALDYAGVNPIDLPLTPDYTYQLWTQYKDVVVDESYLKIVPFEEGRAVISFYCDVLRAERACKLESDRIQGKESAVLAESGVPKQAEMAMGLAWSTWSIGLGDDHKEKMAQRGLKDEDLPKKCLTRAETSMLLAVSLEYEQILLPGRRPVGGEDEMREHFAELVENDVFCSVNLEKMRDSSKWQFLFETLDRAATE